MAEQHTPVIKKNGVYAGRGRNIDFIEGTNVTLTVTEDEGTKETNITIDAAGAAGAPSDADYLVGTANAGLSAEIVVGTAPGGELGGTWAVPTVDATHSGSAHHAQLHATAHEPGGGDAMAVNAAAGTGSLRSLGAGATNAAAGDHSHAGAGHTIADAGVAETQRGTLDFQDGFEVADNAGANSTDVDLSYGAAGYPLDVAAAEADGTAITVARADHVHAHGSGYLVDAHHAQAHSGADHTDPAAPTTVDIGDAAAAGTGTLPPANEDHVHGVPAPGAAYPLDTTFAAEADGTATTPARSGRRHRSPRRRTRAGRLPPRASMSASSARAKPRPRIPMRRGPSPTTTRSAWSWTRAPRQAVTRGSWSSPEGL